MRYYGTYSNKTRGQQRETSHAILNTCRNPPEVTPADPQHNLPKQGLLMLVDPPPKRSASLMRPLWRDLMIQVWGGDPLECPCCHGKMKLTKLILKCEEIEFFLRLHGLWEGVVHLPRPPPPPFDIETMEPIEPPWQAIKEWIPDDEPDLDWFNRPRNSHEPDPDWFDQRPIWQAPEIHLDDGRTLVLESN